MRLTWLISGGFVPHLSCHNSPPAVLPKELAKEQASAQLQTGLCVARNICANSQMRCSSGRFHVSTFFAGQCMRGK